MSVLIVGGGLAGLTLAERLVCLGRKVTVVEREEALGGLARSFHYDNGFHFDLGPHRFHTHNPQVQNYLDEILGSDRIIFDRSSGVYLFGKYLDWPLRLKDIRRLPIPILAGCFVDLWRRRLVPADDSFASYIMRKYGVTIYNNFFENYTRKFLRLSPDQIHHSWALASIKRAIIDPQVISQSESLTKMALSVLFPKQVKTAFLYPRSGTIDVFSQKLAQRLREAKGQIITGDRIQEFEFHQGRLLKARTKKGVTIDCEQVVWTAPINNLLKLLGRPAQDLKFLSTVFYNLAIYGPPKQPFQWCYFGEREVIFSRTSCMNFFNPAMVPDDCTALTVELPCYRGDMIWEHPEKFLNLVIRDLIKVGYLDNFNEVKSYYLEKVRSTYPVYTLDYLNSLQQVYASLSEFRNLYLLGRSGTFWYNNMDHSIAAALDLVAKVDNEEPFIPYADRDV